MERAFAIFGSCVTRDAFELGHPLPGGSRIGAYVSRTTINSSLSTAAELEDLFALEGRPNFEERCVMSDVTKNHFEVLREKPFDYLLLDLIDERHSIIRVGLSYLCYSVPLLRMAETFALDTDRFERFAPQDPQIVQTTLRNIPRFLEELGRVVAPDHIILHEALWATSFLAADGTMQPFPKQGEIKRMNDILSSYYAQLKAVAPMRSIALPEAVRVGDEKHRWSLEPFHYTSTYYDAFIDELDRLTRPATALAS